jgi:two-component system sensor histidine kinase PilS (NtrC family)
MIRNNAKRIDRIVGEVLQLNRRDRQQPEVIDYSEFIYSLVEEVVQAEDIPPASVIIQCPSELYVLFDRGHLSQIMWNLVRNAWQHCQKKDGSIHIMGRAGYMGDAVISELADDGPHSGRVAGADIRAVLHDAAGRDRAGLVHCAGACRCERRGARALAQGSGCQF